MRLATLTSEMGSKGEEEIPRYPKVEYTCTYDMGTMKDSAAITRKRKKP